MCGLRDTRGRRGGQGVPAQATSEDWKGGPAIPKVCSLLETRVGPAGSRPGPDAPPDSLRQNPTSPVSSWLRAVQSGDFESGGDQQPEWILLNFPGGESEFHAPRPHPRAVQRPGAAHRVASQRGLGPHADVLLFPPQNAAHARTATQGGAAPRERRRSVRGARGRRPRGACLGSARRVLPSSGKPRNVEVFCSVVKTRQKLKSSVHCSCIRQCERSGAPVTLAGVHGNRRATCRSYRVCTLRTEACRRATHEKTKCR